jgi:P2 family phage major capsid protein
MRNDTRVKFNAYCDHIAKLNGVASATQQFTSTPSIQQTLETRMQESSAFLQSINVIGVDQQEGNKIGLTMSGPLASTTNTATTDRAPVDPTDLEDNAYKCEQTNFDSYITYQKLDAWAKFQDFQTRIRNAIIQRQALDRIMIGFNGTTRAATSNKSGNPLLQDVNIGWLQKYRTHAAARVLDHGARDGATNIRVGVGSVAQPADYLNLDALVYDATNTMIEPWYRDGTQLVAIVGRAIMADKYFPLLNQANTPENQLALDLIVSQKRIGGLQAVQVPFMPEDAILVTPLSNLSLYWQNGTRRRTILDYAKRDRIENYESSNDAYVVEVYGAGCLIENIIFEWALT